MRKPIGSALVFCLLCLLSFASLADSRLEKQRKTFALAQQAMDKGNANIYLQNKKQLRGYPLTPYLTLAELKSRLASAPDVEVEHFLIENGDLPQARMFKFEWLKGLASAGKQQSFLKHYSPELNFVELDCHFARFQLESGQLDQAYALADKLWMSSTSRPNACDPVFEAWNAAGLRTEDKIWQRLVLAVEARNYGLARFLVKEHPQTELAQLLVDVAQKPSLIKNTQQFKKNTPEYRAIASLGLRRFFREDADSTLALLPTYNEALDFSDDEKIRIARDVGVILAKRFDPRAFEVFQVWDPQLSDVQTAQWNARLLLRLGRWQEAHEAIQALPQELAANSRWKYWKVRSAQLAQPESAQAKYLTELYQELAQERDFYGFMSADRSNASYALNHSAVQVSPKTLNKVRNSRSIQRAIEFQALGNSVAAQLEWEHASKRFTHEELLAQALLAAQMDWHNPAIRNLARAQYWDDLEIRFPLAYQQDLVRFANMQGIQPSWAYAITRQESAFAPTVRSHAGAMGLMQLMPGTAKETAKRYGIPLSSTRQALNPTTNIQLGTAYLNQMMHQFNGNRILATAAYNAGPTRVHQWLKDSTHLPYDIWIESIPFDETRQYVQNVLTYSVIYGQKLNIPTQLVEWNEQLFELD